MADAYHHAQSSVKKWGGEVDDYLPIHHWFDESKKHFSDPRHRALRHHSEGIGLMIDIFGPAIQLSTCMRCGLVETSIMHDFDYQPGVEEGAVHEFVPKTVPTKWIGERHVLEDLGRIPTVADWLRCMTVEAWMVKGARKLSVELEREALTRPVSARARAIGKEAVETEEEMERINEMLRGQSQPTQL